MPLVSEPGTGPNGCYTVDDLRKALADQPGDSTVMTMTVQGDRPAVVMSAEPVLNDVGRVLLYLFTLPIPDA